MMNGKIETAISWIIDENSNLKIATNKNHKEKESYGNWEGGEIVYKCGSYIGRYFGTLWIK